MNEDSEVLVGTKHIISGYHSNNQFIFWVYLSSANILEKDAASDVSHYSLLKSVNPLYQTKNVKFILELDATKFQKFSTTAPKHDSISTQQKHFYKFYFFLL